MLIFDGFPGKEKAEAFARWCREYAARQATVCMTVAEAVRLDHFPFKLAPPIVLVSRDYDYATDLGVVEVVRRFGGQFAGT